MLLVFVAGPFVLLGRTRRRRCRAGRRLAPRPSPPACPGRPFRGCGTFLARCSPLLSFGRPEPVGFREVLAESFGKHLEHPQHVGQAFAIENGSLHAAPYPARRHHAEQRAQDLPAVLLLAARNAQTHGHGLQHLVDQAPQVQTSGTRHRAVVVPADLRCENGQQCRGEDLTAADLAPVGRAPVVHAFQQRQHQAPGLGPTRVGLGDLRKDDLEHPGLAHQVERALGRAAAAEAIDLLEHPRRSRLVQLEPLPLQRRQRLRLDLETEPRRELDRAQDANRILSKANVRVADGPYQFVPQIRQTLRVVQHGLIAQVVEQRVDREVASQGIFLGGSEDVVVTDQQVPALGLGIRGFLALECSEGRDLDDLPVLEVDVRQSKAPADDAAVPEQPFHLSRRGGRPHVEVLGLAVEQQVAYATAH